MKVKKPCFTLIILILITMISLTACTGEKTGTSAAAPEVTATPASESAPAVAIKAELPVLLTSSGQSADVQMVKVLLDKAGIQYTMNPIVKAEEIKDVKTLIIAAGGSSKGLGAAGINTEDELARVDAVIAKAKELNLKIIMLHIGGEARRGELSDKFINECVPDSDYMIVVEEGDKDGLFTNYAKDKNIPLVKVAKISEAVNPLKELFQ